MGDPLPPLGGPTVNAPPGSPPPVFPMRDLPRELTDEILASYLAKLELEELCEAKLLQICILLRGTNQCNDPDDPLWKAACARFGLTERLVGGLPDAPATPTWHVTFLAMCKEVATLLPAHLATYKGLLRGEDAYTVVRPWSPPPRRLRAEVRILWYHATWQGLLCMTHSLMNHVANIVNYNYGDGTALENASYLGHAAVVEALLAHGADHAGLADALRQASEGGHLAVVEVLLARGANVHADDDAALWDASRHGHATVVEVLLAHGADVHADNDAALRDASWNGHLDVVEVLLARGADVHADNDAALKYASWNGHPAVVELLLEHGADVHAGRGAALRNALRYGHVAVVQALRAAGA